MSDIVKWLRSPKPWHKHSPDEVADEIVRLYQEYARVIRANAELGDLVVGLQADLAEAEALLLDMRQHQGRIQPYIARIDAWLARRGGA